LDQSAVTALVLFVVALGHSAYSGVGFLPITVKGLVSLVGLALVSQVAGQGLMTLSLGRLPTVFSSLVIFMEAFAAALLGWAILDEALTLVQLFGGIFILAGISIARPKK
jgi:drug/metabolite transporter (DMT)-like permease